MTKILKFFYFPRSKEEYYGAVATVYGEYKRWKRSTEVDSIKGRIKVLDLEETSRWIWNKICKIIEK
jgi:hypothetical protein